MKVIKKYILMLAVIMLLCCLGFICIANKTYTQVNADASTSSTLKLNGVFGDNMVLQRGKKVKIWGRGGSVGSDVVVSFNGQTKTGKITADGWSVYLDSMEANAVGQTLTATSGSETLTVNKVVVGEVLFCSGQSNIAISVTYIVNKNTNAYYEYKTYNNFKNIRIYTPTWKNTATSEEIHDAPYSEWITPSKINDVKNCSAFAVGLAMNVQAKIGGDIPVGVIETSTGGSCIEQWLSVENDKKVESHATIHGYSPATYYNGMVASLKGMTINGVFWYQGECCVDFASTYKDMLAVLIDQYRDDFEDEDLPVYVMQLPQLNVMVAYERSECEEGWVKIREAQQQIVNERENVYTVCIIDTGDATDHVDCIHPADKWKVTERAAGAFVKETLNLSYGAQPEVARGSYGLSPEITSAELNNGKLELILTEAVSTTDETIQGFTVINTSGDTISLDFKSQGNKLVAETTESIQSIEYLQDVSFDFEVLKNEYGVPLMPFSSMSVTDNREQFTVKFMNDGSVVSTQKLYYGKTITDSAPTKVGYTFDGWYLDSALSQSFSASTPVTSNMTLYAKYVEKTDTDTSSKDTEKDEEKKSGCDGSVSTALIVPMLLIGVLSLVIKKRKNEKE